MDAPTVAGIIIAYALLVQRRTNGATRAQAGPGGTYIDVPGVLSYSNVPGQGVRILFPSVGRAIAMPQVAEWPADWSRPSVAASAQAAGYDFA